MWDDSCTRNPERVFESGFGVGMRGWGRYRAPKDTSSGQRFLSKDFSSGQSRIPIQNPMSVLLAAIHNIGPYLGVGGLHGCG